MFISGWGVLEGLLAGLVCYLVVGVCGFGGCCLRFAVAVGWMCFRLLGIAYGDFGLAVLWVGFDLSVWVFVVNFFSGVYWLLLCDCLGIWFWFGCDGC